MAIQPFNSELLQRIANPQPIKLPDPVEGLTKVMQLKNLAQQGQMSAADLQQKQLQVQQEQLQQQQAQAIHQVLSDPASIDQNGRWTEQAYQGVEKINPSAGAAFRKQTAEGDTAQANLQTSALALADTKRTQAQKIMSSVRDLPSTADISGAYADARKTIIDGKLMTEAQLPETLPADQTQWPTFLAAKSGGPRPVKLFNTPEGSTTTDENNPTAPQIVGQPKEKPAYDQELAAFNADPALVSKFGPGPMGLAAKKLAEAKPSEFETTLADFNAHPDLVKKFGSGPIGFDKYKAQQKLDEAAAGRDAQSQIPEIAPGSREFKAAQDLAYGKLTFNDFTKLYSSRTVPAMALKSAIYQKAGDLNPNFNPAQFEMGFKLASSPKVQQQLASMDNVKAAVPDLLKLSDEASRTGITVLNNLIIKGGFALSDKHYSNLATARTAFADELSGALGFGTATDMAKEMGFNMTRPDLSPSAFRSAIQTVVIPFIDRKKQTLLNQMGVYGQPGMQPGGGPQSAPAAPPLGPSSAPVKMKAPDGTFKFVNPADVPHFQSLGATVVGP